MPCPISERVPPARPCRASVWVDTRVVRARRLCIHGLLLGAVIPPGIGLFDSRRTCHRKDRLGKVRPQLTWGASMLWSKGVRFEPARQHGRPKAGFVGGSGPGSRRRREDQSSRAFRAVKDALRGDAAACRESPKPGVAASAGPRRRRRPRRRPRSATSRSITAGRPTKSPPPPPTDPRPTTVRRSRSAREPRRSRVRDAFPLPVAPL